MKPVVKNILAVIVGIIVGSIVNIVLVTIGPFIINLPDGADVSTPEKLKESMPLFSAKHFIFPFLGHAVGTLVGAFITAKMAASRPMIFALGIGIWFLLGGLYMVVSVGGPLWFQVLDLLVAYLPMGYLGGCLASKKPRASA